MYTYATPPPPQWAPTTSFVADRTSPLFAYKHQYEYPWTVVGRAASTATGTVYALWARQLGYSASAYSASYQFGVDVTGAQGSTPLYIVTPLRGGDSWLTHGDLVKSRVPIGGGGDDDVFRVVALAPLGSYVAAPTRITPADQACAVAALDSASTSSSPPYLYASYVSPPRGAVGAGRWDVASNSNKLSSTALLERRLTCAGHCRRSGKCRRRRRCHCTYRVCRCGGGGGGYDSDSSSCD